MAIKHYAIITAGGTGTRLNTKVPKQFLLLGGKPLLAHSLDRFREAFPGIRLIVTLPAEYREYWQSLCQTYTIPEDHEVIEGGEERFHSIKKALKAIGTDNDGWIAIHDGVRPFVTTGLIQKAFEDAQIHGSAIPAIPLNSSIRQNSGNGWEAVDRNQFRLIQTPQVFHLGQLQKAYDTPYHLEFTDDAGVYENAGFQIHLTAGIAQNIKITTDTDLKIAECLAEQADR